MSPSGADAHEDQDQGGKADQSAAVTLDDEHLTSPGIVMGTVAYMSPEQVRGEGIDARTDLFSFGAVLYEMATGRMAFSGNTTGVIFGGILHSAPTPPLLLNPHLPAKLERFVSKALEKDREIRYQHASDLRTDLKRLKRDSDFSRAAGGAVAGARHRALPQQKRWLLALVASIAVLLALLVGLNVDGWRDRLFSHASYGVTTKIDSLAVLPLENLSGDKEQDYFADGMTEELIATLGKISALRVISRTSVMQYKGASKPLPQIGRELNVDAVVEGSVMRSGDRVRITAQLVHAASDRHLWAESCRMR